MLHKENICKKTTERNENRRKFALKENIVGGNEREV